VKKAIDKHAERNSAELDRSRPVKKGAATRRRLSEQVADNTKAQVNGHEATEKANRIQAWQCLSD